MASSTTYYHQVIHPSNYTQQVENILQTTQYHYRQQQQQLHSSSSLSSSSPSSSLCPPIKLVYNLFCRHCNNNVCTRGMKAILLADTQIELYSTDIPTPSTHLMDKDYLTHTCSCRIRDVACLDCGNIIGYHVVSPCKQCLSACNNGHFWMFHSDVCRPIERKDSTGKEFMVWNNLPGADKDISLSKEPLIPHEQILR